MIMRIVFFAAMLLCSGIAFAQVGFNNNNPSPNSILDLKAIDKGLLIPRLSKAQREAIAVDPVNDAGLLVFDTTDGIFYFYNGSGWFALNEWVRKADSPDVSAPGTVTAPNYALNATGNGPIPKGGIIMWSGTVADIPAGWALCDGVKGPDLRDRFIVGAGGGYTAKTFGGSDDIKIKEENLPQLAHTISVSGGDHTHKFNDDFWIDQSNAPFPNDGREYIGPGYRGAETTDMNNDYMYYREKTTLTSTSSAHSHTATAPAHGRPTATQTTIDNRPKYFALAYIIKL